MDETQVTPATTEETTDVVVAPEAIEGEVVPTTEASEEEVTA
jgi:hypothetical protein